MWRCGWPGFDYLGKAGALRVVDHGSDAGKITLALRRWRNQSLPAKGARNLTSGFPIEEEKGLVFSAVKPGEVHRAANVRAELVPVQAGRLRAGSAGLEAVQRREGVVTVKPPERGVNAVRTGLGGEVDLSAWGAAHIGRIGAGLHFELVDGVDRR